MEDRPVVSVIVPVYNAERHLRDSVGSLCAQTLENIEIVCVDDQSTDHSLEVLRQIAAADPRVRVIEHAVNGGPALARKTGILASRGEFVMFMDNDDNYYPNSCQRAVELIRENDCDIFNYCFHIKNRYSTDPAPKHLKGYDGRLEGNLLLNCFKTREFTNTLWDKIFRGDICRRAASFMEDRPFKCAYDDTYTFFCIAFFATTYAGTTSEFLYCYKDAIGYSTNMTAAMQSVQVRGMLERFLKSQGALEPKREELSAAMFCIFANCVGNLLTARRLCRRDLEEAVECWGDIILLEFMKFVGYFSTEFDNRFNLLPSLYNEISGKERS